MYPKKNNDAGDGEISLTEQAQIDDRPFFDEFPSDKEAESLAGRHSS
jgi:hypothetical protein